MFDEIIRKNAILYNVPEVWIRAVIQTESSFNPRAYRAEPAINDASYGLMQLLVRTAKGLGFAGIPEDLFNPEINIELGTKLIAQIRGTVGDNATRMYSAYNSGKPDAYLTSTQVATHVNNFLKNLETWINKEPFIAATGGLTTVIVPLLLWYWTKNKGK